MNISQVKEKNLSKKYQYMKNKWKIFAYKNLNCQSHKYI